MRPYALSLALGLVLVAVRVAAQDASQDHPMAFNQTDIENGTRVYNAQCSQCHGPNGDMVSGIDLRLGQFRRVSTPDDLARTITAGIPGAGMPPFALTQPELNGIVAFIRSRFNNMTSAVPVGNAARGRAIYDGKGGCAACHRVHGAGSLVAPDLSDVGLARTPAAIQQTLLDPSSMMLPINRPVRIAMKDGRTIVGRRLNEDTFTVQLVDDRERLLSLAKSAIRTLAVDTKSTMPSYVGRLTGDELADLIAYLLSLKGKPQ